MAAEFGVDADAVGRTASELTGIRSAFDGLGEAFGSRSGATGSSKIEGALDHFFTHSSDARKKLDAELERAAGLLSGLAEGATRLDGSLARAITVPAAPAAHPQPAR
jgi:hypothetical protein